MVFGGNLLSSMCPVVVAVCADRQKYPDPELRAAAALTLAKFMLVRCVCR